MTVQGVSGAPGSGPLEGQWGGDRLSLVIDAGGGRIEMDCATGTIAGPIALGGDGRFSAAGTFDSHSGGPQRADTAPTLTSVRYAGELSDGAMKLTILTAGPGAPQVFMLRKGAKVKLVRCL